MSKVKTDLKRRIECIPTNFQYYFEQCTSLYFVANTVHKTAYFLRQPRQQSLLQTSKTCTKSLDKGFPKANQIAKKNLQKNCKKKKCHQ